MLPSAGRSNYQRPWVTFPCLSRAQKQNSRNLGPKAQIPETEWKASSLAAQDVTWTRGDSKLSARGTGDDELQEPLA